MMSKKLTATDVLAAMERANEAEHPAQQAFITDHGGMNNVVVDGCLNFERFADELNKALGHLVTER